MSAPPAPGRFDLRRIRSDEFVVLLREAFVPLQAWPGRLIGWFALVYLPIFLMLDREIVSLFLRAAYGAVAYAGFTVALEAARRKEPPAWRHVASVFGFGEGKLVLLIVSGVLPAALGLLALLGIWGPDATAAFLKAPAEAPVPGSQQMELAEFVTEQVTQLPFTFVAPVCALYSWSGSQSMAVNLMACLVNWRWALLSTAAFSLAAQAMLSASDLGPAAQLLIVFGECALDFLLLAWTLALARRMLPPP